MDKRYTFLNNMDYDHVVEYTRLSRLACPSTATHLSGDVRREYTCNNARSEKVVFVLEEKVSQ